MRTLFICLLLVTGSTGKTQLPAKSDSLLPLILKAKEDTNKVKLLYDQSKLLENTDIDKSKVYAIQARDLSSKLNYEQGLLKSYKALSHAYAYQSKFDSVIYYNNLVINIAIQNRDTFNIGIGYFNLGVAYRYISDLEKAVEYTLIGARLLENKGYDLIECQINDGLQALYQSLMQYDKAITYGKKAVSLGRKLDNKSPLINALNNLGVSYKELGLLGEASRLFQESYQLAVQTENKLIEAIVLNNLCDISIRQQRYDDLKKYADRAIQLHTELEDDDVLAGAKIGLAAYYLHSKDLGQAKVLATEALRLSTTKNLLEARVSALQMLSNISFASGDIPKGFDYLFDQSKFESEVFNESLKEKETGMRIRYETEQKEAQIKQLEAEKKVQQLNIRQKNILNAILIGGAVITLIISLLLYRNYRHKQKLQLQRITELETEKQLAATEAVLKGEEIERTRLAKDLHDGLGGMLSGTKYALNTMKGNMIMTPENAQAFERSINMLDSSIQEMRRVAHNMMPETLVRFGLDTALKDFCNDINQSGALQITYQSFGLENIVIEQTTAITIYRIVQELINNTMIHAAAVTAIVQLTKTDGHLSVTVEDDGKGFDTTILKGSKGIGWSSIQNRVAFLQGKLDVDSAQGKGTSVFIEIDA